MLNLHDNPHADAEFVDSITHLAPPWGSAVHFGGPKIRAKIALSFRTVRPNSRLNLHCNHHAHAEFDDSITLLSPPWGSAVHFGGAKIRTRIALAPGPVPPKSMVNPHCNRHAHAEFDDSITHLAPPWGPSVHFGGPETRARIALPLGAVRPNT